MLQDLIASIRLAVDEYKRLRAWRKFRAAIPDPFNQ